MPEPKFLTNDSPNNLWTVHSGRKCIPPPPQQAFGRPQSFPARLSSETPLQLSHSYVYLPEEPRVLYEFHPLFGTVKKGKYSEEVL